MNHFSAEKRPKTKHGETAIYEEEEVTRSLSLEALVRLKGSQR
jgi:hypothetical protein